MFRNHLKIAWRSFVRNRLFSAINLIGLSLGMAAFGLLLQYNSFQSSFDQFHQQRDRLYRLLLQNADGQYVDFTPSAVAPVLRQNVAGITGFCRLAYIQNGIVTIPGGRPGASIQSFREEHSLCADPDFFRLFSFPLLAGTPSLQQPKTVAISASKARTYFGEAARQPSRLIGRTLTLNNQFGKTPYTITAIFADVPPNSDFQFDMVYSLVTLASAANRNGNDWARLDSWENSIAQSVVLLDPQTTPASVEATARQLAKRLYPQAKDQVRLQPLRYVHLGDGLNDPRPTNGRLGLVYLLGGVAGLILLLAWLNYVNLSTATALKRVREVGVRKAVGAGRGQLIGQFLGESLLLNGLALLLALGLIAVLQEPFNRLTGQPLSMRMLTDVHLWAWGLLFVVVGAVLSGGYAAFALSGVPVLSGLTGGLRRTGSGKTTHSAWVRQGLVVFQFGVSMLFMVATGVLYRQLAFMQHRDMGMNIQQLLVIKGPEVGSDSARTSGKLAFRTELARLPYVERFSNSGSVPGQYYNFIGNGFTRLVPAPGDDKKSYAVTYIDDSFVPTYHMRLMAGQNFSHEQCEQGTQSRRVMLNEQAVRSLGFGSVREAVGQRVRWENDEYEIVGVLRDYHHQSVQQSIQPQLLFPGIPGSNYTLRLSTSQMASKVGELERLYRQVFVGNPFEYFFVDERYNEQYQAEQQYGRIFTTAAGLAILIACLGLFGLATFIAQQRTKEIGVRKVLGASVASIVALLSKDFLKLVLIAIVIASPIAYYAMNRWLQDFAYRVDLSWWVFALAGLLAVSIALLTVSVQSIRAALVNPVKSLRSE